MFLHPRMSVLCEGCGGAATLQCPTCRKLGLPASHFCNQVCFKANWGGHKSKHKQATTTIMNALDNGCYIPYPNYCYSGRLRPSRRNERRTDVPKHIQHPDYWKDGNPLSEIQSRGVGQIRILNEEEIAGMKLAGRLGREVMDIAASMVKVGVTTEEIDDVVYQATINRDCYPSPLNYRGFPKSCCTSVNEVICHGIPDQRPLEDGDIVNIDITVFKDGFHGDLNETFYVGNVDEKGKKLVEASYECLQRAIASVKPGAKYRDVGNIIQKYINTQGFSVVRSYCGHGINQLFHTAPSVPHYAKNKAVGIMKPGHCFTIEPMINEGTWGDTLWPDDWTAVTTDGKRSSQFEQTLLVTETGCVEIFFSLNYRGFPKSCCTSVNEVICHGIPDQRPLEDGDIVNIDITVFKDGFHGDLNETFYVGNVDEKGKKLVEASYECLQRAIASVKPGAKYRDVGNIIQKYINTQGLSVVRSYCGHGINQLFHTAPSVPHYAKNKAVGIMKPGHCFTIEPMINEGTWGDTLWPDDWTAVTTDGKRSSQFEQTLLVTETGCEILTGRKEKGGQPYFRD
eukprot:sb/3463473/